MKTPAFHAPIDLRVCNLLDSLTISPTKVSPLNSLLQIILELSPQSTIISLVALQSSSLFCHPAGNYCVISFLVVLDLFYVNEKQLLTDVQDLSGVQRLGDLLEANSFNWIQVLGQFLYCN